MIIRRQVRGRDVEIHAIEKRDGTEDKQPSDEQPANAARPLAHAACARKSCTRRSAMIFSSPSCSCNEVFPRPVSFGAKTGHSLPARDCLAVSHCPISIL